VPTFLEIVRLAARESGTFQGERPVTTTGAQGRELKLVEECRAAWRQIQNSRADWLWLQGEFHGTDAGASALTSAGNQRYTPAAFNLTRLARWGVDDTLSLYAQALGLADETIVTYMRWEDWREDFVRGVQPQQRPLWWTVSPANELCLGPIPDAIYVVRGLYDKTPQDLPTDTSVPDMPARFHDLISWWGLLLLSETDEATFPVGVALRRRQELLDDLHRDQLPVPRTGPAGAGPLA
jgi:hypothetical protein